MSTPAERLRELILSALATSSEPLPPRDIHAYCGGADKQKTYVQIHSLKTRGLIVLDPDEHGAPRYRLPVHPAVETVTQEIAMPVPGLEPELAASADLDANGEGGTTRTLTLDLSGTHPRLHTSGAFEIRVDLLNEIAMMIEHRYREAA